MRSLFLLLVFTSTFTWPYFQINGSGQNNSLCISVEVSGQAEDILENIMDQGQGEPESDSQVSSLQLLEDFIHDNLSDFSLSGRNYHSFYNYSEKLLDGHNRFQVRPPQQGAFFPLRI